MKVLCLTVLTVLLCVVYGNEKRQLIGICVEQCSVYATKSPLLGSLGIKACPPGTTCQSNGCGHVCKDEVTKCSDVMCAMYCQNGFKTGADGCPICTCKDDFTLG